MHGTFEYDAAGMAIAYNCGCYGEHSPVCAQVCQIMIDWANGLGRMSRARVGKRNLLLGGDADIEILARQRNGR